MLLSELGRRLMIMDMLRYANRMKYDLIATVADGLEDLAGDFQYDRLLELIQQDEVKS